MFFLTTISSNGTNLLIQPAAAVDVMFGAGLKRQIIIKLKKWV